MTHEEQNWTKNRIWSNTDLPKMLDKIIKIQYFAIRQLPSPKPLPTVVLAKNERYRDRLECPCPIPVDPHSETRYWNTYTRTCHTHVCHILVNGKWTLFTWKQRWFPFSFRITKFHLFDDFWDSGPLENVSQTSQRLLEPLTTWFHNKNTANWANYGQAMKRCATA